MPDPNHDDQDDPLADVRADWLQLVGDDATLNALIRRHRERHRRYHTLDHVLAVVRHAGELASIEAADDFAAIVAAAWFHDAVYEPRSSANERASARLARRDLAKLGWTEERTAAVGAMIEGTAQHLDPVDIDTAVLFDADLAILGAPRDVYARYVANVRAEYAHVDDAAWTTGRADVLDAFLQRERIFATVTGFDRWESDARANLRSEIDELRG